MKKTLIIVMILLILVVTHILSWMLGWKAGYIHMAKWDCESQMRLDLSAYQALSSNNIPRLEKNINVRLGMGITDLERIETNSWRWFNEMLPCSIDVEFSNQYRAFKETTLKQAREITGCK